MFSYSGDVTSVFLFADPSGSRVSNRVADPRIRAKITAADPQIPKLFSSRGSADPSEHMGSADLRNIFPIFYNAKITVFMLIIR